jgi:hypothetical protein
MLQVDVLIQPEMTGCPGCAGTTRAMGEDLSYRLGVIPAQHKDRHPYADVRLILL